jgi:thioredoxin 1
MLRYLLPAFVAALVVAGCAPSQPKSATPEPASPQAQAQPAQAATETAPAQEPATSPATESGQPAALPALWDFFATWCGPCRDQAPIIAELEKEYAGKVEIRSIDIDQNRDLAERYKVQVVPTLVFIDSAGNEVDRKLGMTPKDELVAKFRSLGFIE